MNAKVNAGTGSDDATSHAEFGIGVARAAGAALIFSLPMLMTMEMWWLGFYMDRLRLALFLLLLMPMLVGLSHWSGFEHTGGLADDVVDAFVAFAVAVVVSAAILALLGIITFAMPWSEVVGKITLQAIPASFGAMLARSQLGGSEPGDDSEGSGDDADGAPEEREPGYGGELFLMCAGALFIAFNLAPTEEMVMIAYRMTTWHLIALALFSLGVMHSFIYSLEFKGGSGIPEDVPWWNLFLRFSVTGYAIALLISVYVLWTFGRLEALDPTIALMVTIVLALPATVGAAAARLIL